MSRAHDFRAETALSEPNDHDVRHIFVHETAGKDKFLSYEVCSGTEESIFSFEVSKRSTTELRRATGDIPLDWGLSQWESGWVHFWSRGVPILMGATSAVSLLDERRAFLAIAWSGLTAGILDIAAAFAIWGSRGVKPARVLQGIASGLLGVNSFKGGVATAALGASLHFLIAFVAAAVYYVTSRKFVALTQHAAIYGMIYGITVFAVMNLVVVPLSAVHRSPVSLNSVIAGMVVHMVCVGLPISFIVRRYSR